MDNKEPQMSNAEALIKALQQQVATLRAGLENIKDLDPSVDSEEGHNEWGEAECFTIAQKMARQALELSAKGLEV